MSVRARALLTALVLLLAQVGLTAPSSVANAEITVTSPADGSRGGESVTMTGWVAAPGSVHITVPDGAIFSATVADDLTWTAEVTGLEPGYTYALCAVWNPFDTGGYSSNECVRYTVANPGVPPYLHLQGPYDGTVVAQDFTVWVQVYEPVDYEIYLDDVLVAGGRESSSLTAYLTGVSAGAHTVTILATDLDGDVATQVVNITVEPTSPGDPTPDVEITWPQDWAYGASHDVPVSGTAVVPEGGWLEVHEVPVGVEADGTWSTVVALSPGADVYPICANLFRADGLLADQSCIHYQVTPPRVPDVWIWSPYDGQSVRPDVLVQGTVLGGSGTVDLYVDDVYVTAVPVAEDGTWGWVVPTLTEGPHTVYVTAANDVGTAVSSTVTFVVDTVAPAAPRLDHRSGTIRAFPYTVTGTGEPGSFVCAQIGEFDCVHDAIVGADGRWSITIEEPSWTGVDLNARRMTVTYWAHDGLNQSASVTATYRLRLR